MSVSSVFYSEVKSIIETLVEAAVDVVGGSEENKPDRGVSNGSETVFEEDWSRGKKPRAGTERTKMADSFTGQTFKNIKLYRLG